ncbi:ATP-binding protein [Streptomyces sp. DG2A-72]|uniref:ATP-binding protein n=1 Tax=Streptomyces sp. DG2A-72 TaxID=3051386 RepID=UPI00265C774D|nr:ATP-binding protein [Streptomyces sp. DG2A-72]MDO0938927.1 ATP-binding protein [Streptomyces sp. DG2A-72]
MVDPPKRTIRVRLTLLYGGLVMFSGVTLLLVTYVMLDRIIATQPIDISSVYPPPGVSATAPAQVPESTPSPSTDAGSAPSPVPSGAPSGSAGNEDVAAYKEQVREAARQLRADFRRRTLKPLVVGGSVALGLFAVGGLLIGWLVSGRTLRPISRITATARRVADRSLHERIGLTGPHDELRELADTFDDMLSRLDAAFEGQQRFVANASHELKTPLAINRTLLEVAMGRPDAPPQVAQLGENLLAVNARHERLIDGLLTLARSQHEVADPVPVDLTAVVRRVADLAQPDARRAGVTLTLEAAPALVEGDPVLLERLAQNLVQNAIRYNTDGGWVRVVCGGHGDDAVRLTVDNSGPEVAPYEAPALFEPFRRLDDRVGSAQGTGLGLSIVRSVARGHGGEASAAARTGGGLTVRVALPAQPSAGDEK